MKARSQELQLALQELTEKQERFVLEYSIDWNASAAARRAGYSAKSADDLGRDLTRNPRVQRAISIIKAETSRRKAALRERLINQIAKQSFSDIGDFMNWNGSTAILTDKKSLLKGKSKLIKRIVTRPGEHGDSVEIELVDKLKSQEMLGKHLGLWDKPGVGPEGGDDESNGKGAGEGGGAVDALLDGISGAIGRLKSKREGK